MQKGKIAYNLGHDRVVRGGQGLLHEWDETQVNRPESVDPCASNSMARSLLPVCKLAPFGVFGEIYR
jgi:hypothetical protein